MPASWPRCALDGIYDGEAGVIDAPDLNAGPDEPTGVDQFSSLGKAKPTAQRTDPRRGGRLSLLATGAFAIETSIPDRMLPVR